MKVTTLLLKLFSFLSWDILVYGQYKYEVELLAPKIYKPCEKHPNNFFDTFLDFSNLQVEQTEDGTLIMDGYLLVTQTLENELPLSVEMFKKERGTWQPTVMSQKRPDMCVAFFDNDEVWHDYFENMPEDQRKCPFAEGLKITFAVSEAIYIDLPMRNSEGEYKIIFEVGEKLNRFYSCAEAPIYLHKI